MFFAAIVLLGCVSIVRLPMQILPDISPPYGGAFCWTRQNMSYEELERKIITPIEGEIAQLPNVKNIHVWSGGRGAFFPIEFEYGTNVKYRIVDLQERLDRFRRTFPRNSVRIDAFPFDTSWENKQMMDLVLKGPRSDPQMERIDAERIRQRLQDIDGVAEADIWGGKRRSVDVTIFQDRLREFGVAFWQVRNRVQTFANEPVFLGDVEDGNTKYYVRLNGQFSDTNEIADVVVKGDGNIAVRHLGEVEENYRSRRFLRRMDGKPALGMDIEKEALVNPIELSNRTKRVVEQINEDLPEGYELAIVWDQADNIRDLLIAISKLAALGILFSMVVLYLFVRNVKMTAIICIVLPISIIATFNCMYFSDMSINMLTLLGLAVGVGTLIDSSIVVLENVFRHHERGRSAISSALVGSHEVGKAVFAFTLTTVVVFLPIVFVEGTIRLIFMEGALAIIYPLIISMLVALTLVPMATSRILLLADQARGLHVRPSGDFLQRIRKLKETCSSYIQRIPYTNMRSVRRSYGKLLKSCLRHRIRFLIAIVLVILYTCFYTFYGINRDVLQAPQDNDMFGVYVYLPNGTQQDYTLNVVHRVEDLLLEQVPEADHIHAWVMDDFARFRIMLKKRSERKRESHTIQEDLRPYLESFTEAEVTYNYARSRGEEQSPPMASGRSGIIEIRGPEYEQINTIADTFIPVVSQIPGIRDVQSETEAGPLEYQFRLDRDACAHLQITPQTIAQSIQLAQRRSDYGTIQMKQGDNEIDIIFGQYENPSAFAEKKNEDREGLAFEELLTVPIYSPALNSTVALEELGTFELRRGMGQIQRENRERIGRIRFETSPTASYSEVEEGIRTLVDAYPLATGYRMSLGGRTRQIDESFAEGQKMLFLSILLVYMCIASLFESFSLPFVIILAIPLAIVGIVWLFILTHTPITELAIMGAIFLVGILPNPPILLIHVSGYLRREKNFPRVRAVMVSAHTRLRPILMTVLTTVLGLLPMAFAWQGGGEEWIPFARCVIGGLASSTILTLLIVPGFYFIIEDLGLLISRVVRYVTSWRWIFIFWSRRRRQRSREELTSYRRKDEREEPLCVIIDHLTRIYPPSTLEATERRVRNLFSAMRVMSPTPGFLPHAPMSDDSALSTRARKKALDGFSIRIEPGMFGLLGPNGAGKTTLLRLLAGIDQPTRGFLSICGYDMKTEAKKAQKLIGYLPQNFGVYDHMTAYQYLDYFALLKGIKRKNERREAIYRALEMVNLLDHKDVPVGAYSGGMMRRIGLAQIFVQPPKVLIVDEPTVGLDPLERVRFRNLLAGISRERIVILSTHIVEDVAHSCKNMAIMDDGKIILVGSPENITSSVQGKVWEVILEDEKSWHEFRKKYKVVSQSHMPDGIRMRIVSDSPPSPYAKPAEPNLEDAYLYHTHIHASPIVV
ncbi:MAG: ATP-binding cassette domain-containing protein [Candidatus Omnitrophota bacterium]|jgi:HAE1 family hydrophobic/amphiphilic exporter-1|nr:MAG: ATP-binding cassette domain-containing protein [Candidatus Omnitrophota bacterium]